MASYFLSQNPTITNFVLSGNANSDTFIVDTGVPSSRLRIFQSGANTIITDGTRTATLQNFAVAQITGGTLAGPPVVNGQFTNNDGSAILIGDNTVNVAGDAGANTFNSTATGVTGGGDLISGLGGADIIDGLDGNDYIVGNTGNDAITVSAAVAVGGSSGNDTILGGQGADAIDARAASGANINLLISGNLGTDSIVGGTGNDTIFGGQDNDTIYTSGGIGLLAGTAEAGTATNVVDGGLGLDSITGGDGNDTLRGGTGEDTIVGGGGSNLLTGQVGDDQITGAGANDTIFGGQGADIIGVAAETGSAQIFANLGNDSVLGGNGNDTINGGQGNDTIVGRAGVDSLTGGLGNDRFVFVNAAAAGGPPPAPVFPAVNDSPVATPDVVTDFVTGSDKVSIQTSQPGAAPVTLAAAGSSANYREFDSATVTSAATANTAYTTSAVGSLYTFIGGATDGYLVYDADQTAANGGDSIVKFTGLTSAGFDFTDII